MITPGRIKLRTPFQETYGDLGGTSVPVYRIFFDIDGKGPYDVMIPQRDFTMQAAVAAVNALAEQLIATMDAF